MMHIRVKTYKSLFPLTVSFLYQNSVGGGGGGVCVLY